MQAKEAEQHTIDNMALGAELTEEQAKAIYALGEETVVFALLKLAKMMAPENQGKPIINRHDDPSCPSGQKPPYSKPNKKKNQRRKKNGRKKGHQG